MNRYGKRCVLYPRVSTEMQVDGYSLEGQKNMLTRFADREEMDYLMFQKGIDAKVFGEKLMTTAIYSSHVSSNENTVTISMQKGGGSNEED